MNQMGQLPEWIDFEMEQPELDINPLVGALKQRRLRNAPTGGAGASLGSAISNPMGETSYSDMLGSSIKSPSKGMKSL